MRAVPTDFCGQGIYFITYETVHSRMNDDIKSMIKSRRDQRYHGSAFEKRSLDVDYTRDKMALAREEGDVQNPAPLTDDEYHRARRDAWHTDNQNDLDALDEDTVDMSVAGLPERHKEPTPHEQPTPKEILDGADEHYDKLSDTNATLYRYGWHLLRDSPEYKYLQEKGYDDEAIELYRDILTHLAYYQDKKECYPAFNNRNRIADNIQPPRNIAEYLGE
jgi:hypothetical protein